MLCDTRVKEISGSASATVRASVQDCYSLLAAVQRYGEWNRELLRELEVLQREPLEVRAIVNVKWTPFLRTIELTAAVDTDPPHGVKITRIPNEPSDPEELELLWRLEPDRGSSATRIELRFVALASSVPRFVPLGGIGKLVAEKLVESAHGRPRRLSR